MTPECYRASILNPANLSPEDKAKLDVLERVPCPTILTTGDHQVVWHNKAFHDTFAQRIPQMKSTNEAGRFGCYLSPNHKPGTLGEFCQECPLFLAYTALKSQKETVQSGSIIVPVPWGNIELHVEVAACFLTLCHQKMYMLSIRDIEQEINRYEINRSLFHDVLNIGQQIRSCTNLARMSIEDAQRDGYRIPTQLAHELRLIGDSLTTVTNFVNAQRQLNNAQAHTLCPNVTACSPASILQSCLDTLCHQDDTAGRLPVLVPGDTSLTCDNDAQLVQQVVYSMLYSMVYVSRAEQIIELGYDVQDDQMVLWMRNRELQLDDKKLLQFQLTYSFKRNRSIYAHTIEILLPYIQGKVCLVSPAEQGTTLSLLLPLQQP